MKLLYVRTGMFGPSFGQQSSYNYFPNNGDYNNAWNSQQVNGPSGHNQSSRKGPPNNEYYRGGEQGGYGSRGGHDGTKSIEQGVQGMGIDSQHQRSAQQDGGRIASASNAPTAKESTSAVPKKMTWASIASQPAKPQIRANSTSSTLKKKGPGMPPPPMVPGKHNMDIGTWDSPKNGPALVPTPPPPVPSPPPVIEPSPLSQQVTKSNNNSNNANINHNNNSNNNNAGAGGNLASNNGAQPHPPSQHQAHQQRQYDGPPPQNTSYGRDYRDGGSGPGQMHRPNWHAPNNRDGNNYGRDGGYGGGMQHQQQFRPNNRDGKCAAPIFLVFL